MAELEWLMVAIAAGDAASFRHFRLATLGKVTAAALNIVRNREIAEEVVQETYLAVWTRAGDYDQKRASPIAWVTAISRNRAIDLVRTPRARASHCDLTVIENRCDQSSSPEEQTGTRQELGRVMQRLGELPADERALLISALFHQTPYAILAARGNMPLPTLKSRIRRALVKLRTVREVAVA